MRLLEEVQYDDCVLWNWLVQQGGLLSVDEFSCPSCRSNLYDPLSGCLVCPHKGLKPQKVYIEKPSPRILREQEKLHEIQHQKQVAKAKRLRERNKLIVKGESITKHNKLLAEAKSKAERKTLLAKSREIFSEEGIGGLFYGEQVSACCPFCALSIKAGKMYTHIDKAHKHLLSSKEKALLADDSKRLRQAVPAKSEQKVHSVRQKNSTGIKKQPSSKTVYYPADQYEHMKESFRQSTHDERDASQSYAHRFRENGQFGSHPSHDDYDDESSPN